MNMFHSALRSDNHVEFALRVESYDMDDKIRKLERENGKLIGKINKLKRENNNIKSTKGYRIFKK